MADVFVIVVTVFSQDGIRFLYRNVIESYEYSMNQPYNGKPRFNGKGLSTNDVDSGGRVPGGRVPRG